MIDTDFAQSDVPVANDVTVQLALTGPGWAELRMSHDDDEYAVRISTFLGPWQSEIARFCDAVRTGQGAAICLLDEPGEVELFVSVRGSDGTVLVQAYGTYPYQARTREMAFRVSTAALLDAIEAGIDPQLNGAKPPEAAPTQAGGHMRKAIGMGVALVFVVGAIWLVLAA